MGQGWDGRTLAGAGMGAPPWAPEQERHHWLAGYHNQGMNGTDLIDGALMGQGWGGRTLAGDGTGAPPWAPEQERHHGRRNRSASMGAGSGAPPLALEGQRAMQSGSWNQFRRCRVFVSEK